MPKGPEFLHRKLAEFESTYAAMGKLGEDCEKSNDQYSRYPNELYFRRQVIRCFCTYLETTIHHTKQSVIFVQDVIFVILTGEDSKLKQHLIANVARTKC
jgi:hypothetical protein